MPRASRKQKMGLESTTPSGWAGPGKLARRVDNPVKIALKGRIKRDKR